LRERPADIPALLQYFLKQIAQSRGAAPRRLAEDTLALLQTYEWPGNLHQLRNTVEWLYISAPADARDPIAPHMLPPDVLGGMPMASNWQQKSCEIVVMPLRQARETFEKEYIVAQIKRFGGNISETARFIGMERSALYRKLKSLGILSAREA
jgi:two-component system nitrogen regulation response regulator NtrX